MNYIQFRNYVVVMFSAQLNPKKGKREKIIWDHFVNVCSNTVCPFSHRTGEHQCWTKMLDRLAGT